MSFISDKELADRLPQAMVFLNANAKIVWFNQAARHLWQLTPDTDLVGLLALDVPQILQGQARYQIEVNYHQKKILLTFIPYVDHHYLLLAEDVTHLHHLERMRQDFVANVSHELRTPLTVMHGYLETLLDQVEQAHAPWRVIFEQMYQQTHRMERLVEDLLLLSRLETDQPHQENFKLVDVPQLLSQIADDARALSGKRNHHLILEIDTALKISGTENELRSAFSNIIFNAVHYTPAEGVITIKWYQAERCAILAVSDSGIGIEAQHIERLTERFYRVDRARSRESGGTGLGLAIVKHVLTRHEAQLKITSILGQGSTFCCIFPVLLGEAAQQH